MSLLIARNLDSPAGLLLLRSIGNPVGPTTYSTLELTAKIAVSASVEGGAGLLIAARGCGRR